MWVCWCPVTWCLSISPEIFVSRKVLYLRLSGISWSKSANLHWMFPFCYWEPDLKYSPSSLMIREHHQRCAKLFLRAWQTWILFWGQGSKLGHVLLIVISGSSGFTWEASWFWAWGIQLLLVVLIGTFLALPDRPLQGPPTNQVFQLQRRHKMFSCRRRGVYIISLESKSWKYY